MWRWYQRIGLVAVLALPTAGWSDTLRLVGDPWPPFVGASLKDGGLATAIVRAALERAHYQVTFEEAPWARALKGIEEGRYDVLVDAWYSDERARIGRFSAPFLTNRLRFVALRGSDISVARGLSALYPYSIAVVRGYAYTPEFDNDSQLKRVPVQSFQAALSMLAAGRVQLALEDEYVADYLLALQPVTVRDKLKLLDPPLAENGLRILVSLKRPDYGAIAEAFNQAIAAMRADGSLQALFKAYGVTSPVPVP
ncbi:substrate-binding periplasmic protein [Pseudomonas sp. DC3000-4b1]|uniref:substrate-binding periplasmic protein n=1 Tax=unclassified Pseudomonas TaxID=196821 RepID=UPI003CE7D2B3